MTKTSERVFTLVDIKQALLRQKKKLLRAALIGASCGLLFALFKAPKYVVEATFKEAKEQAQMNGMTFEHLIGGILGTPTEEQAIALMQSSRVLKPVIHRLGLQATVPLQGGFSTWVQRIYDNIKSEFRWRIADKGEVVFRDVFYEGELRLRYTLCFKDREQFSVLQGKKVLASGSVGREVVLPTASFTIASLPNDLKIGRPYSFSIAPWISTMRQILLRLKITNVRANKLINRSIYTLSFRTPRRHLGVGVLNELMAQYRECLKRDHDQIAQEQLKYLEHRQEEVYKTLSGIFDDYTAHIQKNLTETGLLNVQNEIPSITRVCRDWKNRIEMIQLELERIALTEQEGKVGYPMGSSPFSEPFQKIMESQQALKQQRDLLELSLQQDGSLALMDTSYQKREDRLKEIRKQRDAAKHLLQAVEMGQQIFSSDVCLNGSLTQWATLLDASQNEERDDLVAHIENYLRLLSMQEKMAQEKVFSEEEIPEELEGIDPETARALFVEYSKSLNESVTQMRHFDRLRQEMSKGNFAISALSLGLTDPLSQKLISQASALLLQLKDEKHRSEKEGARWKEDLDLQKKILAEHLDQLHEVEHLKGDLLKEKISGLQRGTLHSLNGKISVLQEQLKDLLLEQKTSLIREKKILEKKLTELRLSLQDFPAQWQMERWMDFKTEVGMKMIAAVTEIVESKTIGHHLHHVESKAIDPAYPPLLPYKPGLFAFSFLGAFLAAFWVGCKSLFSGLLHGFPTSSAQLKALGLPFFGEISPFCDGKAVGEPLGADLHLLRQISLFLGSSSRPRIVGLLAGKGPDYSYALGENLFRRGKKSLIIRSDFAAPFRVSDTPGLLQLWKGEVADLPIRQEAGYDLILSGGFTPYGAEILQSEKFVRLLNWCKEQYELIFLLTRSGLDTSESLAALRLCDQAVATVTTESTEELTPFVNWAYHEEVSRLAFIFSPTHGVM